MSKFNPDIMSVLAGQIPNCTSLKALTDKYGLSLYSVLTPSSISSIDAEIGANPFILSEAISLLEVASHLSDLYRQDGETTFIAMVERRLVEMRLTWTRFVQTSTDTRTLQQSLMDEYFVDSGNDLPRFLSQNPVYLGIYLYVYTSVLLNT